MIHASAYTLLGSRRIVWIMALVTNRPIAADKPMNELVTFVSLEVMH